MKKQKTFIIRFVYFMYCTVLGGIMGSFVSKSEMGLIAGALMATYIINFT